MKLSIQSKKMKQELLKPKRTDNNIRLIINAFNNQDLNY